MIDLLEQHFEAAFAAPDGIEKLRELILAFAMQGKLVPQNQDDPPASELLKEIEAEKRRLVKEGKLKEPKALPPVSAEEMPYALPQGWAWVRLGASMLKITDGTHRSPPNGDRGEFLYISAKNIKEDGVMLSNATYVARDVHEEIYSRCDPEYGNILYIKDGATTGIVTINNLKEPFSMLSSVALLKQPSRINNRYLLQALKAPFFYGAMRSEMTGVAITRVTLAKLQDAIIPLAPYNEQDRIVDKIDELMARCDALEKLRAERDARRLAAHTAVLRQLVNVADTGEHTKAREFLDCHFGEFYTVKENVAELRKAILQLAVMGKLVPQDPDDSPASELLKQIQDEKKRLINEGILKESPSFQPVTKDELPFSMPNGWQSVRFGEIIRILNGRAYKQNELLDNGTPVLRVGNLFTSSHWYFSDLTLDDAKYINPGDLIYAWSASFGPFIWTGKRVIYHYHIWKIDFFREGLPDKKYLYNFLLEATDRIKRSGSGIAMIHMTKERMEKLVVPLPPLREQKRIVAKVDELVSMCDVLEQKIDKAQKTQSALLNARMARFGSQRCA